MFLDRSCGIFSWLNFLVMLIVMLWLGLLFTTNLSQLKIAKLRSKNKRTLSMILEKGFESTVIIFIQSRLIRIWLWNGSIGTGFVISSLEWYLHHRMASSIENVKAWMGRMAKEDYCVKTCQPRTRKKKGLASIFIKCWNEPIITSYLHKTIFPLLAMYNLKLWFWRTNFGLDISIVSSYRNYLKFLILRGRKRISEIVLAHSQIMGNGELFLLSAAAAA